MTGARVSVLVAIAVCLGVIAASNGQAVDAGLPTDGLSTLRPANWSVPTTIVTGFICPPD
jgi:hypothetical protein